MSEPPPGRFVEPPEPRTATSSSLVSERRLRLWERVFAASGLPFVAAGLAGWLAGDALPIVVLLSSFAFTAGIATATLAPGPLAWLLRRRRRGRLFVVVDEAALEVQRDGTCERIERERLAMAWCKTPTTVEILTTDGDELELELESPEGAAALVRAIRHGADRRRAYPVALEADTIRLLRKASASFIPAAVGAMSLWIGPWGLIGALGGGLVAWLGAKGTPRMRFGADGVSIEGRFRTRYVPYRDVARAEVHEGALTTTVDLTLRDGSRLRVASFVPGSRAQLAKALVEEGARMAESGEKAGAHVAALEREGKDTAAWRERLGRALKESGYRGAALESERLLSLMRNPAAKAEQRVAAAVALREAPGGVAQIRVAAEVSTEPEVRDAFEELAASELDEDRFEKILRRMERAS